MVLKLYFIDSNSVDIMNFLEVNEFSDPIIVIVEDFFLGVSSISSEYKKELMELKRRVKNKVEFYLEISLHSFLNNYKNKKSTNMVTHENHKVEGFSCFNNPQFQHDLKQEISSLDLTELSGILFVDFRYPMLNDESKESDGITCFCEHCQELSRLPDAAEDVKIRDLSDKKENHVNLNEVKSYILNKPKEKLAYNSLLKDKELKKWNQFRCNSITKLLGSLLIHCRSINQNFVIGSLLYEMKHAIKDGQIYEDIATYQDFISSGIFFSSDYKIDISNLNEIRKKLKKAEGQVNFIPFIQISNRKQIDNFDEIRKNLIEKDVKSVIVKIFLN